MQIIRVPVGAFITNCYIAEGQEPGRGFLVDPADNPKKLISILEEKQICPEAILLTHGHFDHIGAVDKLKERYDLTVYGKRFRCIAMQRIFRRVLRSMIWDSSSRQSGHLRM